MEYNKIINAVECILFVSGEAVYIDELCRVFNVTKIEMNALLQNAADESEKNERGIVWHVTDESVQLRSSKQYSEYVTELLQPTQTKSFSQSMMETLTIVAYRQPITRAEIDSVRGVRSEYSITQLIRQGFIEECGRKDVIGHPQLLGTTDKFLRKFGLHTLRELPSFEKLSDIDLFSEEGELASVVPNTTADESFESENADVPNMTADESIESENTDVLNTTACESIESENTDEV